MLLFSPFPHNLSCRSGKPLLTCRTISLYVSVLGILSILSLCCPSFGS